LFALLAGAAAGVAAEKEPPVLSDVVAAVVLPQP